MQPQIHKTALYDLHLHLGAKMVSFAGYEMPLQYADGIKKEHLHCRSAAGLFDVSHMGQLLIKGVNAIAELEKLLPVDLAVLDDGQQVYALLTNEAGGILDDLIITRWCHDCFFVVVNAACKQQDIDYLRQSLSVSVAIEVLDNRALISLQGPEASTVMQHVCQTATALTFMHGCQVNLLASDCYVSRCGYTGEDGFELSIVASKVNGLVTTLLDLDEVKPIGLGARDSLRLEAGLCLYGHDMNQDTTPVEASLVWSISRSRRTSGAKEGGFPGAETILQQITDGVCRKRVGLEIEGKIPLREGAELQDMQGSVIGQVTSGSATPALDKPIAMAYLEHAYASIGTKVYGCVRGKLMPATVVKMPFVEPRYYRG